jgi:hypothetical protein
VILTFGGGARAAADAIPIQGQKIAPLSELHGPFLILTRGNLNFNFQKKSNIYATARNDCYR